MKFEKYVASQLQESVREDMKPVVISPGRFNPPHMGHKLLIDTLIKLGHELNAEPIVIVIDSGRRDERNPLSGDIRKMYLSKMFPDVRIEVAHNPYDAVERLANEHNAVPVGGVTGSDRADSYKKMVGRIFDQETADKYKAEVLARDPDADGDIAGVSATKVRDAIANNNIVRVRAMTGLSDDDARRLIQQVKEWQK